MSCMHTCTNMCGTHVCTHFIIISYNSFRTFAAPDLPQRPVNLEKRVEMFPMERDLDPSPI